MSDAFLCYGETGYCMLFEEQDSKTCLDLGDYPGDVPSLSGRGTDLAAARDPGKWCQGCIEVGVARLRAELEIAKPNSDDQERREEYISDHALEGEFSDIVGCMEAEALHQQKRYAPLVMWAEAIREASAEGDVGRVEYAMSAMFREVASLKGSS